MQPSQLEESAKILDSEPVRNLLAPITKHCGEALGYFGDVIRFYTHDNLRKIFTKWAEAESGRTLDIDAFKKILPLLQLAATVSNEELQTRWASLLESATADTEGFLLSFGQTLSQLTAEEARYLDRLWQQVSAPTGALSVNRPGRIPLTFEALVNVFDPEINTGINAAEWEQFRSRMTDEQKANYKRLVQAELVIRDFERLGILAHEPVADLDRFSRTRTKLRPEYSFTSYGVSFIQAVTAKKSE